MRVQVSMSDHTLRVLMTGADGLIGRRIAADLAPLEEIDLTQLGFAGGADVDQADLTQYSYEWAERFAGNDCLIHLAGSPRSSASWNDVFQNNLQLSFNVFHAAIEHGVRRVIFASSNWAMAGYRDDPVLAGADLPLHPETPYGVSKAVLERYGAFLSEAHGIAFIALRLGWVTVDDCPPGADNPLGSWGQRTWLSSTDLSRAVYCALQAPCSGFLAMPVISRNEGALDALTTAKDAIGFYPVRSSLRGTME
jgi:NAD+ dependent glucose-6-phosphate dehydrogenase